MRSMWTLYLSSGRRSCFVLHLWVAGWQTGRVKNNTQTRLWAVQSIASWLARSIILTGRSHNTTTCTPPPSSLLPMNLSLGPISHALSPFLLTLASSLQYIFPGQGIRLNFTLSIWWKLKEAKSTPKPLHLGSCTRQAMDTEQRRHGVIHCSSEHCSWEKCSLNVHLSLCNLKEI